jgi:tetratricopeptide (TPR) repeat protein
MNFLKYKTIPYTVNKKIDLAVGLKIFFKIKFLIFFIRNRSEKLFLPKRITPLFRSRILSKFSDLLLVFPVFFTPLLFFIPSHDQFELPKLTFLMVLAVPGIALALKKRESPPTPLTLALFLLLGFQIFSSLPQVSLSWRTSLLGDYENFAGLATLFTFLALFLVFRLNLEKLKIEKLFYFNSLTALLSSLYAIGQHFQFDFIQWNAESVNPSREFAALGNPNFLSAYLAMSLPLFLSVSLKPSEKNVLPARWPGFLSWFLAFLGFFALILGTNRGLEIFHFQPSLFLNLFYGITGLILFSTGCVRLILFRHWTTTLIGLIVLGLGLLSTGSRGGFLGALAGLGLWFFLAFGKSEFLGALRLKDSGRFRFYLGLGLVLGMVLLFFIGHGFLVRLADSVIHPGRSLATSRLHIWRPALSMAKANPVWGVGLDNFKIAFPYYSGIEFNQIDGMFMSSRMAHNELLQMASTTGFLGLGAYLVVLTAFGVMWWRTYRSSPPPVQWLLAAVAASALAYHIQNLFSFGVASINLVWFLLLAFVQMQYRATWAPPNPPPAGWMLYTIPKKAFLAFFLLLALIFPLSRLGADIAFGESSAFSQVLKSRNPEISTSALFYYSDGEIGALRRAVQLCPLEVKYRLYLGLAYEQRAQIDSGHSTDWNLAALECYQAAIGMSPANAYYYNNEGRVESVLGGTDPPYLSKAEQAYQKAVHWDPASPFFIINWSNALEKLGRQEEAQAQLQKAFDLDPFFSAQVLAQMAYEKYQGGEKQGAFKILGEALRANTASAEAYFIRGILYLSEKNKARALEDFKTVKSLNPTPEKNPYIRSLDQFMEQAKN